MQLDTSFAFIDMVGRVTEYCYEGPGNSGTIVGSDGAVTRREFDPAGMLTRLVDRTNEVTEYKYDWYGRVVGAENPHSKVSFAYDPVGNLREEQIEIKTRSASPCRRSQSGLDTMPVAGGSNRLAILAQSSSTAMIPTAG